jgi:hypothetical protein
MFQMLQVVCEFYTGLSDKRTRHVSLRTCGPVTRNALLEVLMSKPLNWTREGFRHADQQSTVFLPVQCRNQKPPATCSLVIWVTLYLTT